MTPRTNSFLAKSKTIPETSIFAKHILSKSCESLYQNNGENMNNGVLKPWKSKEIRDVGPRDDWKPPLPGTQGPYTIGVSPGVRCFTAQATTWPNQGPQELPNPCKSKNNQCENRFRKSKRKKHEKSLKMYPGSMLLDFLIFAKDNNVKIVFSEMASTFYKKRC